MTWMGRGLKCHPFAVPMGLSFKVADKMHGKLARVVLGTVDKARLASPQERQAHDIQARCINDAAVVSDAALAIEYRNRQPAVIWAETGRPNHRANAFMPEI